MGFSSEGGSFAVSCSFAASILHCAATFFAASTNALELGDCGSDKSEGFPESEPDIISGVNGMDPRNGSLCFSLILSAPPDPNILCLVLQFVDAAKNVAAQCSILAAKLQETAKEPPSEEKPTPESGV